MRATSAIDTALRAWAACGALSLTGRADGPPLGPPAPLLETLVRLADDIADRSAVTGDAVHLDPFGLLTDRAAINGLRRQGRVSCGGTSRLVRCADGWLAVTLARPEDIDLLPAWLGLDHLPEADDPWVAVERAAAAVPAATLDGGAALLGVPAAAVGSVERATPPVVRTELGRRPPRPLRGCTVVDLSSLWAGPLCTRILADAGARIVKVESTRRPDGARRGPAPFFDLLNAGKESVAVDLTTDAGRAALHALLSAADVVVDASRPRALQALGIDAAELAATGPAVWVSITGHGREGPLARRVGFGDDTAAAGGAVVWDADGPCFCADALADPLTGMTAALAVLDAFDRGGRWLLDIALSRVAAAVTGPTVDAAGLDAPPPREPVPRGTARPLGADTATVLAALR